MDRPQEEDLTYFTCLIAGGVCLERFLRRRVPSSPPINKRAISIKNKIKIVDGTWTKGEDLVGESATREIRVINTDDTVTAFADNDNIETAADAILDFSDSNPFGDP